MLAHGIEARLLRASLLVAVWLALLTFASLIATSSAAEVGGDAPKVRSVDWVRAYDLLERQRNGEQLKAAEQDELNLAKQAFSQTPTARRAARATGDGKTSPGFKPLSDMTADDRYQGLDGGLYGHGKNEPPPEHLAAALRLAAEIRPLGSDGKPATDGRIALASIGMSNTTQEFSRFMQIAADDKNKSAAVKLIDGAQGGQDTARWANSKQPWEELDNRLRRADVSPQQVQVVWIKQAHANPAATGGWPKHNEAMEKELIVCLSMLHERFPNLKIAYLSSRIYAGNASSQLNPEPYAYENAFAMRHLIQQQIAGDAALNWDAKRGAVKSPLLLWGPYLWANGESPRKSDGLTYTRADFGGDGTHPSESGRQKVAEQLLKFLKTDPTAKPWFVAAGK